MFLATEAEPSKLTPRFRTTAFTLPLTTGLTWQAEMYEETMHMLQETLQTQMVGRAECKVHTWSVLEMHTLNTWGPHITTSFCKSLVVECLSKQ